MKKCPECGLFVEDNALTCAKCGYPFRNEEQPEEQTDITEGLEDSENGDESDSLFCEENSILNTLNPEMKNDSTESKNSEPSLETETMDELKNGESIIRRRPSDPFPDASDPGTEKNIRGILDKVKSPKVLCGIAAFLLLCGIVIIFTMVHNTPLSKKSDLKSSVSAQIDLNGSAFFIDSNYRGIEFKGDASKGLVSADGENFVILEKDGTLLHYNKNGKNKETIATNVSKLNRVRNSGVIYTVEEDTNKKQSLMDTKKVARYLFDSKETIELGFGTCSVARESLSLIFMDESNIYILPEKSSESVEVFSGNTKNISAIQYITNDGNLAVWSQQEEDVLTVYGAENGEMIKIGYFDMDDSTSSYINSIFINNDSEVVIYNDENEKILRKKVGEEPISFNAGGSIYNLSSNLETASTYSKTSFFSENGGLDNSSGTVKDLFVQVRASEDDYLFNFYRINQDGNRQKLLSNISFVMDVSNGKVFYIDQDANLYTAQLGEKEVINPIKISSDVMLSSTSVLGDMVYYIKETDSEESYNYSLYCSKIKGTNPESEKISDNVDEFWISSDGKVVVYKMDSVQVKDTYLSCGELYRKEYGKDAKKISSDVISIDVPYHNSNMFNIDNDWLSYTKYDHFDKKGQVLGKYVYYNGKDETTIASDIIVYKE